MVNQFAFFASLCLVVGYFACFGSLFLTAWVRDVAEARDFVDRPDGGRKKHQQPVALGGGVAVLLASAIAISLVWYINAQQLSHRLENPYSLIGLAIAALLLCGVGLYDDLYNMRGVVKLGWQLVAACLIVAPGSNLVIERIQVFGFELQLGHFGAPLAIFWIIAAVNSLNLIDGMDGLATTIGLIFSMTIGVMALHTKQWPEAVIAFAMAGGLLGFLRHNWPPAKIYLGDSGSMLIGVVLGTLVIRCEFKDATSTAVAAPIAIFAIPFIDSAAALIRRKLTGRSMYTTDRGHIHHRLLTQNFSNRQALLVIGALSAVTCTGSTLGLILELPVLGPLSFGIVLMILVGTRIFGHSELMLLNNRIAGVGRMLMSGEQSSSSTVQLQGSLPWEEVWQGLLEAADKFNLMKIRLNLYLPRLHEDFFATWQRRSRTRVDRRWTAEIPLVVDGAVVGVLSVTGVQEAGSVAPILADFAELVEPLEHHLSAVVNAQQPASSAAAIASENSNTKALGSEPSSTPANPVT